MIYRRTLFLWVQFGLKEVRAIEGGFILLRFESEVGLLKVLSRPAWLFMGQPIFLNWWSKEFDFHKDDF